MGCVTERGREKAVGKSESRKEMTLSLYEREVTTIRRKRHKRLVLPRWRKHTTGTVSWAYLWSSGTFSSGSLSESYQVRILDLSLWGSTHRPWGLPSGKRLTLSYLSSGLLQRGQTTVHIPLGCWGKATRERGLLQCRGQDLPDWGCTTSPSEL